MTDSPTPPFGGAETTRAHPRTLGWFGNTCLALAGSNLSLFLIGALLVSQGTAAVPLLIVGLLDDGALRDLQALAVGLSMQAVVEVHSEAEVARALRADAMIIGINNLDLTRMKTDRETTVRLRSLVPAGRIVISESGMQGPEDILRLHHAGARGFLVGEALMRAQQPGELIRSLKSAVHTPAMR